MEPEKLAPYFGTEEKPECHLLYNATTMCTTWNTIATRDARLLRHQTDVVAGLPERCVFLNYIRCHDDIGWGLDYGFLRQFGMEEVPHKKFINDYLRGAVSWSNGRGESYNEDPVLQDARLCGTTASLCGLEKGLELQDDGLIELGLQCDRMLHAFLLTQSGVPMLYSGDEIGQLNDYSYHQDPDKAEDSRFLHRGVFSWEKAARRSDPNTVEGALFQSLRQLEQLRRDHPAFGYNARVETVDGGDQSLLCLLRQGEGETILALFNFNDQPRTANLVPGRVWEDLLTGEPHSDSIPLEPYGFRFLR
jgi:amylosucrase